MRLDVLTLWYLGNSAEPRPIGTLRLVSGGKGVSLQYGKDWLASGFAISDDLPLADTEFLPPGRLFADAPRAVGAVDDARPDRWGEKVIRFVDVLQRRVGRVSPAIRLAGEKRNSLLRISLAYKIGELSWKTGQCQSIDHPMTGIVETKPIENEAGNQQAQQT